MRRPAPLVRVCETDHAASGERRSSFCRNSIAKVRSRGRRGADEGRARDSRHHANDAYEAALAALREDTRDGGTPNLPGRPRKTGTSPAIALDPSFAARLPGDRGRRLVPRERLDLINRPAVRDQAFGEALDPEKIERLCRYEVHLDRKLELREFTVSCLIRGMNCHRCEAPSGWLST